MSIDEANAALDRARPAVRDGGARHPRACPPGPGRRPALAAGGARPLPRPRRRHFLVYEDERTTFAEHYRDRRARWRTGCVDVRRRARATASPSPCATCPSGSWPSGRATVAGGVVVPAQRVVDRRGARLRARRLRLQGGVRRHASAAERLRPILGRAARRSAPWSSPTSTGRDREAAVAGPHGPRRARPRSPSGRSPSCVGAVDEAASPPDVDHRPRGRRHHLLHVGHHRAAQGRGGHPPQHGAPT